MKSSRYNYFVDDSDGVIVFNGLSERFFKVNRNRAEAYREILANPDRYYPKFGPFLDKMCAQGFVHHDDTDEENLVVNKYRRLRRENEYHLMLLPTYQCNLRCWYCTQKHADMWIPDSVQRRVRRRISRMLSQPGISHMRLSWFGGEPLLAYETVLEMTEFARNMAAGLGKGFSCDITTNGTLLDSSRIESLRHCGVSSYQVTIDGERVYHDSVKRLPGKSAFEVTMQSVNEIARHTVCNLRFNYTHKNLAPDAIIQDIGSLLSEESRGNVTFNLYKVWQEDGGLVNPDEVRRLYDMGNGIGMTSTLPQCAMCYADHTHFDCIFPDGTSEKCDNQSPDTARGVLTDDGSIEWDNGAAALHVPTFESGDSECAGCEYLPVCWGPCVAKRDPMLKRLGRVVCQFSDRGDSMSGTIRNIVRNVLSQEYARP